MSNSNIPSYLNAYQTLTKYGVVIKQVSGDGNFSFGGLINDDSLSWDFGIELDSFEKAIQDSKIMDKLGDVGGKFGAMVKTFNAVKSLREDTVPSEGSTLRKPKSWSNPSISFSVTFFEGMNVGKVKTGTYKEFMKALGVAMLPDVTLGSLDSSQVAWKVLLEGAAKQMVSGVAPVNMSWKPNKIGFSISIGSMFKSPGGWWLTSAPVTTPTVYDQAGQPVIWRVNFRFEYFKQITAKEWGSWFV